MSYYRDQLEQWLKGLKIYGKYALDLGGASNPVHKRVAVWDVQETDYFDNGAEPEKENYIDFDINISYEHQDLFNPVHYRGRYDVLFCLEVFEYVWNPVVAMQNIFDLTRDGGNAYVSFPAIYPVHNPVEIDYLRYTKEAIKKYGMMMKFKEIEIKPRIATRGRGLLSAFYVEEGMHPVRRSDLPYDIGYLVRFGK